MSKWGGPAFPVTTDTAQRDGEILLGMSLRDYFAAHAPMEILIGKSGPKLENESEFRFLARLRFQYADAMVAERSKEVAKESEWRPWAPKRRSR